jgi:ABC-type lipoprotein release transport system permease subunit
VSYRLSLVGRWSRRDRLAVVVVATLVALLVGSAIVVLAAGAETTRLAADINASGSVTLYDDPARVPATVSSEAVVTPVARVTVGGQNVTLLGVPPDSGNGSGLGVGTPPDGTVRGLSAATEGAVETGAAVTLTGVGGTVTRTVRPRGVTGPVPPWWAVTSIETVEAVGTTDVVVVDQGRTGIRELRGPPPNDAPLVSVFAFFVAGTDQFVGGLGALTVGTAVLVVVVVSSVTRMTVRDRLETLAVLRATGLSARRLLALFGVRVALLSGVGAAVGAAAGVVLTNAVVNAAVFLGVPTTLSLRITPAVFGVVAPAVVVVWLVGSVAGLAATLPAVRRSPAALDRRARRGTVERRERSGRLSWLRPDLLPTNAVVPTAATLAVFVGVVLVSTTAVGAVAPLEAESEGTVLQDGVSHPWASRVDADYSRALRAEGVPASGEVYVFSVVDGEPFFTRGANFTAFASVSKARLTAGRAPRGPAEAVVGRDLARSNGIDVGDSLVLGGSDRSAFARVCVVGQYRAPGVFDDQLVVPLRTARHLSRVRRGDVNVVRFAHSNVSDSSDGSPSSSETVTPTDRGLNVQNLSVPRTVSTNQSLSAEVVVANPGSATATQTVTVTAGPATASQRLSLGPGQRRTVSISLGSLRPGRYTVRVAGVSRNVTVVAGRPLALSPMPDRGPPNATVRLRVTNERDEPVANATVTAGDATARTGPGGRTTLRLPASGETAITATAEGYASVTQSVRIVDGVEPHPVGTLSVSPSRTTLVDPPSATVTAFNPWNRSLTRTLEVGSSAWTVSLAPGERLQRSTTLPRTGTGVQRVRATSDGAVIARASYEVAGDERVVAALATGGYQVASSGLGQAASSAFGNLRVLLGTLVGLAGLATVATTTAAFARTVHARRHTVGVYRATGATPRQVLERVLVDAGRIALVATLLALVVGFLATWLLGRFGVLSAFGVALVPSVSPVTLLLTAVVSLLLALLGATVAVLGLVRAQPATLFTDAVDDGGTADG